MTMMMMRLLSTFVECFHVPDMILGTSHALSELKLTIILLDGFLLLSHVTGEETKSQRNEGIFTATNQQGQDSRPGDSEICIL